MFISTLLPVNAKIVTRGGPGKDAWVIRWNQLPSTITKMSGGKSRRFVRGGSKLLIQVKAREQWNLSIGEL